MAFIQDYTPPTLKLFLTCDIQEEVLSAIKRDFALGAHEGYGACARLVIDERKDLHGLKSPEDVLRKLQADGTLPDDDGFQPFLLADETTARDGLKATLWMIENWAQAEDYYDEALVPGATGGVQNGRLPFAEKLRIYAYYAPLLYVNLEIANTDIGEEHPYPYDPNAEQEPANGGADWRFRRPSNAYVVADSSNYEVSTHHNEGVQVMKLGAPPAENANISVYRLRSAVAKDLGLVPEWAPGSVWSPDDKRPEHGEKAQSVGLDLSSAVSFTQPWDWQPPTHVT